MSILTNEDFKNLQRKAIQMKSDLLFEEPCPIYDGDSEDWDDFWYGDDE